MPLHCELATTARMRCPRSLRTALERSGRERVGRREEPDACPAGGRQLEDTTKIVLVVGEQDVRAPFGERTMAGRSRAGSQHGAPSQVATRKGTTPCAGARPRGCVRKQSRLAKARELSRPGDVRRRSSHTEPSPGRPPRHEASYAGASRPGSCCIQTRRRSALRACGAHSARRRIASIVLGRVRSRKRAFFALKTEEAEGAGVAERKDAINPRRSRPEVLAAESPWIERPPVDEQIGIRSEVQNRIANPQHRAHYRRARPSEPSHPDVASAAASPTKSGMNEKTSARPRPKRAT